MFSFSTSSARCQLHNCECQLRRTPGLSYLSKKARGQSLSFANPSLLFHLQASIYGRGVANYDDHGSVAPKAVNTNIKVQGDIAPISGDSRHRSG